MVKRAVYLLKTWIESSAVLGAAGIHHYAVLVENDKYEIVAEGGGEKSGKRNTIKKNVHRVTGMPTDMTDVLTLAGATSKTDKQIKDFNDEWEKKFPRYDVLSDNCQKFAFDFIQYLVGASFKMDMPLSSVNAWADGPGSHAVSRDGYHQARATTGKAGAQYGIYGVEAEGPSAGAEVVEGYAGVEASVGRAEGQIGPVGARLEPNLNTGAGFSGGQVKAKVAGFGVTVGKGFGIHTPLGSLGFGKF